MLNTKITKLPKSVIEIEGELEADVFESYYSPAIKKIGEHIELPGFRKGKAPENVLVANLKEIEILQEMAELAISEHYPKLLEAEKIDGIGHPDIAITKIARKSPLGFKVKIATLPTVTLPDYKMIAKKVLEDLKKETPNHEVTDKELEDTITDIRKSRAMKVHMAEHVHKEGEEHTHPEPELPEFNDEFVKGLGPFENVEDFKEKLKVNIKLEKENAEKEKTRLKIMEEIINASTVDVPEVLTDLEIEKIIYRMEADISAMGLKFEDYLKHLNKTTNDLKNDFYPDAEKKAKFSLIMNEIGKAEKITPEPEQVANEVALILEHYKDADPERARLHAENVLTNEQIFKFLESQV